MACLPSFQMVEHLFLAVVADTFPPLFESNATYVIVTRYINKLIYRRHKHHNKQKEMFCIEKKDVTSVQFGEHLFRCADGAYISALYLCDGVFDCPDKTSNDDKNCWFFGAQVSRPLHKSFLHLATEIDNPIFCKPLYQLKNGKCQPHYSKSDIKQLSDMNTPVFFRCSNGQEIDQILVDGLVIDCLPQGDDEPLLLLVQSSIKFAHCKSKDQIPNTFY